MQHKSGTKHDDDEPRFGWWDSDARSLDCVICFKPFEAEIFMVMQERARRVRIDRKCWCCPAPIDTRCRPLKNALAEMSTHCRFKEHGCGETLRFADRRRHEAACPRAPCACPVAGCAYRGELLYQHVREAHADGDAVAYLSPVSSSTTVALRRAEPWRVLVQAGVGTGRVFALLNGGFPWGRTLSLVCVGPRHEGGAELSFKMEVDGGEHGTVSMEGTVPMPCVRRLEEAPEAEIFVVVPDAYWGPSGTLPLPVSLRIS
ncbi:hypothetical protein ACP4OV_022429 [Aristida adscensionis]